MSYGETETRTCIVKHSINLSTRSRDGNKCSKTFLLFELRRETLLLHSDH